MKVYMFWAEVKSPTTGMPPDIKVLGVITAAERLLRPYKWEDIKKTAIAKHGESIIQTRETIVEVDDTKLKQVFEIPDISKTGKSTPEHNTGVREF